jgi:hypothetical protein
LPKKGQVAGLVSLGHLENKKLPKSRLRLRLILRRTLGPPAPSPFHIPTPPPKEDAARLETCYSSLQGVAYCSYSNPVAVPSM